MKSLKTKFFKLVLTINQKQKESKVINEIVFLSDNNLSISEIELFLNIKLTDFDLEYLNKYYKDYANLFNYLNILQILKYIEYNEKFKKDIKLSLFKKLFYPIFLIFFGFTIFTFFKYSIIKMLSDIIKISLLNTINILYFTSILIIIIIILIVFLSIFIFKNPAYFIIVYYRIYKFRLLFIIELYYLNILSYLLLTFYLEGLSTKQTFILINQFKGNTIIANLAYFLNSDLLSGKSLEEGILKMRINENFKSVLLFSLKSNTFEVLMSKYQNKLYNDLFKEIEYISKILHIFAYVYIGIIVLILYKIISLPINLIDTI